MCNYVNVIIIDDDVFFTLGLRYLLIDYFSHENLNVNFVEKEDVDVSTKIDYLFKAEGYLSKIGFCQFSNENSYQDAFFFTIQGLQDRALRVPCQYEAGIISRFTSLMELRSLLDTVRLNHICHNKLEPCHGCKQFSNRLTRLEKQVLYQLQRGYSHQQIALKLSINVKVVYQNKSSSMKKLNFMRKSELYYWLLSNDLSFLQGSVSEVDADGNSLSEQRLFPENRSNKRQQKSTD